jgi:UDP-N-acetylglucosamine 1-carboxyvinyltransferase
MPKLVIEGGASLHGEVIIPGSKNAATPVLAACLLTSEECVVENVPEISDVARMLELLQELGVKVTRQGNTVRLKAASVQLTSLGEKHVKSMRSSVLLFGPLLARLGQVRLPEPGGCIIGNRPLSAHLEGFRQLGVAVQPDGDAYNLSWEIRQGAAVTLPEFSVTATENVLMAAVLTPGRTTIDLAAAEPHVADLCNFLNAMGAKVTGIGTHHLEVQGVASLHGATHRLIPDSVEVGTWAVLAAVSRGELTIGPVVPEHLSLVLLKLREIGVSYELVGDRLKVSASRQLKPFKLQALPYPGFPTDLQAPFSVLATQASGTSLIHDPLYEGRLNHIAELIKMGANAVVADPHRVVITGPTPLYGREIRSFDLRAGATLIIAALMAQGETIIHDVELVDRGYEHLDSRLRAVGAKLKRE